MTRTEVIQRVIKHEERSGPDMNITHGTAFWKGMIRIASKNPVGFMKLICLEIERAKKK